MRLILQDKINSGMAFSFTASPISVVLDQILLAIFIFLCASKSKLGSFLRLIDNILLEASLVIVIANTMDPSVTVRLVLKQIMPW